MIRLFVRHQVSDFADWKLAYDAYGRERRNLTVIDDGVYQSVVDPEDVTIWLDFEDLETALTFVAAPIVERAMELAGVTGEPIMWLARPV